MKKNNIWNSIKLMKPKKNLFDLSHDVKLSGDMGNLIPIMALESIPGDKFSIGCESLIRFAPMVAPVMHRFDVTMHYFFVPRRILWEGWSEWISRVDNTQAYPYITLQDGGFNPTQLKFLDYMGCPPPPQGALSAVNVDPMPFAAYQLVYNEYYRDQNLVSDIKTLIALVDGDNNAKISDLLMLRKRAWEHDYFTSALPFAQKGDSVSIPLGTVELNNAVMGSTQGQFKEASDYTQPLTGAVTGAAGGLLEVGGSQAVYDPAGSLQVEPTSINDLRRAYKLQEWMERAARGGTRYVESILAHFGVRSSDARLQRPEYITGIKTPVQISEVLNTAGDTLPQGNMAGHGVAVTGGKYGNFFCEEHGIIIGIMSVMPKPAYMQGVPKMYLKNDQLDHYWPSFAHIGEQEVKVEELYAYQGQEGETFGYVPRYSEYKYIPNRVAGEFRSSLDYWHLAREFATAPALNQTFIEVDPAATKRIFAVQNEDTLYCHVYNRVKALRPMPVFSNPGML